MCDPVERRRTAAVTYVKAAMCVKPSEVKNLVEVVKRPWKR